MKEWRDEDGKTLEQRGGPAGSTAASGVSHGLQLQSLWRIPTAAVSQHVFGRKVAHFDGAAAENAGFGEVRAQMWTATRHDGPNHLIACCGATCPPAQQLALITSDRAVMRASRASTSPNHLGSCCDARPPSIKSPE